MDDELLSAQEAARRLGITPATLYDWLGQSNHGLFVIRGQRVAIDYLQGGAKGQGRIKVAAGEVARIKDLMRVRTQHVTVRRPPIRRDSFPGITVPLGRPR
jgi:transposase-like protein